jgi:hypothetical protein
MQLELTNDEAAALVALLNLVIADDKYPLPPRVRALKEILAKLRPEPVWEPLQSPHADAPPKATVARRRGR